MEDGAESNDEEEYEQLVGPGDEYDESEYNGEEGGYEVLEEDEGVYEHEDDHVKESRPRSHSQ